MKVGIQYSGHSNKGVQSRYMSIHYVLYQLSR